MYGLELIDSTDFANLQPVTQVQAVCFQNDQAVIYKDKDGNYGLPGGTIEEGESYEQAFRREIREEVAAEVTDFGPFLFLRTYEKKRPDDISYQLRYWAEVELLGRPVNDPDGKAVERIICSADEALDKLDWEKSGDLF